MFVHCVRFRARVSVLVLQSSAQGSAFIVYIICGLLTVHLPSRFSHCFVFSHSSFDNFGHSCSHAAITASCPCCHASAARSFASEAFFFRSAARSSEGSSAARSSRARSSGVTVFVHAPFFKILSQTDPVQSSPSPQSRERRQPPVCGVDLASPFSDGSSDVVRTFVSPRCFKGISNLFICLAKAWYPQLPSPGTSSK